MREEKKDRFGHTKDETTVAGFEQGVKDYDSTNAEASTSWKRQEMDYPPEPLEMNIAQLTP